MIGRLGLRISAVFRATAPDPFVLAVLLTLLTFALAFTLTDSTPASLVDHWGGPSGVWSLLAFGMQMCLILVTGHALASSPPVSAVLNRLASLPRTGAQAAALVAFVACTLSVCNWGLGLIAGGLLAKRVGEAMERSGRPAHYPLLAAAGYLGFIVWHGGFSGSAPLKVTTPRGLTEIFGETPPIATIDLSQTLLSPLNLVVTGGLIVLVPLLVMALSPRDERDMQSMAAFDVAPDEPRPDSTDGEPSPFLPRLLEDSPLVTLALVGLIGWWAWRFYMPRTDHESGIFSLNPDTVNLTMLLLGLVCHGTPRRYVRAVERAVTSCAGIILQFPLYAGIMAVMKESGMTVMLAEAISANATPQTLPVLTFFSAGVVNLFVPSGGGQWAVQGPIAMQAAIDAGVSPAKMVMAVAYGDQLTNMLQPFWALPVLAITGVKARDIVGYTALVMVVASAWVVLWLVLVP
ncbi:MAG: short-chain fatty acid transporter [Planctomycetota bacterium]|nr:MAG: short-chain fatty acid transporter [Planctomycetota bacterium]